jgi:hypothetical protein
MVSFEEVMAIWQEGQARVQEADPSDRAALERVIDAVVAELRHRLGGSFTTDELARLYLEQGTDWCFDIAVAAAPSTPAAWDLTTISGAAFARYVRMASDYGGGRRRLEDSPEEEGLGRLDHGSTGRGGRVFALTQRLASRPSRGCATSFGW